MSHHQVNQLLHVMWSTIDQKYLIPKSLNDEMHAYVSSIIKSENGRVLFTGGANNHIHLIIKLPPEKSLSNLLGHVKAHSSRWINSRESIDSGFSWQKGYVAFSTQESRIDSVCKYIMTDENRHLFLKQSYTDELRVILGHQNIKFDEKYFLQSSFSKILVHAIWSTHNRTPCLGPSVRDNLYKQITKTVSDFRGIVHKIGGVEDHVHLLMEMPKDQALSNAMREIKTSSTCWLKLSDETKYRDFEWQTGFGGFTVSLTDLETVKNYIQKQEEHHRRVSFQEEWEKILLKTCVE